MYCTYITVVHYGIITLILYSTLLIPKILYGILQWYITYYVNTVQCITVVHYVIIM